MCYGHDWIESMVHECKPPRNNYRYRHESDNTKPDLILSQRFDRVFVNHEQYILVGETYEDVGLSLED